jgi:hypothetical protein
MPLERRGQAQRPQKENEEHELRIQELKTLFDGKL